MRISGTQWNGAVVLTVGRGGCRETGGGSTVSEWIVQGSDSPINAVRTTQFPIELSNSIAAHRAREE